ncbi:protein of unknown function [Shewanella benthica]|uniref:Uncharacterized protein n=1 Tax=Shewanella benthica TaxID=43661 RepID=A0A330M222_9GAMM|nr:protein of unknown function [Shewanella benthica]
MRIVITKNKVDLLITLYSDQGHALGFPLHNHHSLQVKTPLTVIQM